MTTEADRVTEHEHIADHADAGLALFYRQFRDATKLKALARAWLDQVQIIEDALWEMLTLTGIDTAAFDQLDQIGALLKFSRGALADTEYRAVLRAVILARRSSGTPEDLLAVADTALGATTFSYREGNCSGYVEPHAVPAINAAVLLRLLKIAKPAGMQIEVADPPVAESDLFTFAASGLVMTTGDTAKGFSDTTQVDGGQMTGVAA